MSKQAKRVKQDPLPDMPKPPVTLIGISGKAQSGKDTAASILVGEYEWVQLAFADPLKELAAFLNPIVELPNLRLYSSFVRRGWTWDEMKKIPEVRRFLQYLGEGVRQILGQDIWIEALRRKLTALGEDGVVPGVVITDVRYPNEAELIQELGGLVVRIERRGAGAGEYSEHSSETALDDFEFDIVIDNNADKHILWSQMEAIIGAIDEDTLSERIQAWVDSKLAERNGEA